MSADLRRARRLRWAQYLPDLRAGKFPFPLEDRRQSLEQRAEIDRAYDGSTTSFEPTDQHVRFVLVLRCGESEVPGALVISCGRVPGIRDECRQRRRAHPLGFVTYEIAQDSRVDLFVGIFVQPGEELVPGLEDVISSQGDATGGIRLRVRDCRCGLDSDPEAACVMAWAASCVETRRSSSASKSSLRAAGLVIDLPPVTVARRGAPRQRTSDPRRPLEPGAA